MARKGMHKDNLVRTAMRLFRQQGFAATGLQQITAESGAPKGSLYHYFPGGKDDLAVAAVELAGRMVADMMRAHLDNSADPDQFVNSVVGTYAKWMKDSDFSSGCPIATTMLECAVHAPEIRSAGLMAIEEWSAIATDAFEMHENDSIQAGSKAEAFIAGIQGALILSRIRKSAEPLEKLASEFSKQAAC